MKTLKTILLTIFTAAAAICAVTLFGCGSSDSDSSATANVSGDTSSVNVPDESAAEHVHSYSTAWCYDETSHYKLCSCGDKSESSAHTWNDGADDGEKVTYTCTICGATKPHTHAWGEGAVTSAATCVMGGVTTYACTGCSATKTETTAALGHDTEGAAWEYNLTQHYRLCKRCNNEVNSYDHAFDEDKTATVQPSCTSSGERALACSICGYKTTEVIEAVSHSYSAEWSHNETSHYKTCIYGCGTTGETAAHVWDEGVTSGTEIVYTCTVCNATKSETNHSHSYADVWSYNETSHYKVCQYEGCSAASETAAHSYDDGVVTTEATETATGVKTYTCTVCGYKKTETLAKLKHTHTYDTSVWKSDSLAHYHPATCGHTTAYGNYTNHTYGSDITKNADGSVTLVCTVCGHKLTTSESPYTGNQKDDNGKLKYDGELTQDTYAAFDIGGTDKTYSFIVYGRSANGIYYKVFYYGSGTITLSYEYFYARGTKTEKASHTLTSGQSFTWYLDTVDFPNVSFDITTESDEEFCGVIGLVCYGEENPDSNESEESDFTVGEQKTVDIEGAGSSFEFIAPYSGTFVITCGDDVVICTSDDNDSATHGSSYTFTLEKGESLSVDLYPEDWKATTTTVLITNA